MDEIMVESPNGGKKTDSDKVRMDLLEPLFLEGMARVLTYGAEKYGDTNWRGLEKNRIVASLMRHLNNWRKGEVKDKDAPFDYNMVAVAVNAMFLCYFDMNNEVKSKVVIEPKIDKRYWSGK